MTTYSYTTNFSGTIPINSSDVGKFAINDIINLNISFYDDQQAAENGATSDYQTFQTVTVTGVGASSISVNDSRLFAYYGKYANVEVVILKTPQTLTAIGGYVITAVDGTSYHFALPSYDYDQFAEIRDVSDPSNKKSIIRRVAPFANTWVLTAITGSDFVDRNQNGIVDDSDWGHWVKFNYGVHMNDYHWRLPYAGFRKLSGDTHETHTEGKKQLVYLNSIETRSHVALFLKGNRTDGKSANASIHNFL
jgi:hypothetical protein